jgi:hypothetical protein
MARRFRPLRTQTSATSKASPDVVYDTIADLRVHLEWSGERASSDTFKLLELEGPDGPATVGTTFTSSGAADNGTFHDRSVVREASRPTRFTIETDSRLDRKRGEPWEAHFSTSNPTAPVPRSCTRRRSNARTTRPTGSTHWCGRSSVRSSTGPTGRQLQNLARLAEERSAG